MFAKKLPAASRDELAKYGEYIVLMSTHKMPSRLLPDWLLAYRQTQKLQAARRRRSAR